MTAPRLPVAVVAALGAGLLLWLAFPPVGFGLAIVPAVALLTWAQFGVRVRRGLLLGLVAGTAWFLPLLSWMHIVGWDAAVALALLCAGWLVLQGAATALVTRLPGWPLWVAATWVLQESLRGAVPYGGFPWGRLAFAQPDLPLARLAPWLGLGAVTFAAALAGTSLLAALLARRQRGALAAWLSVAALCVAAPAVLPRPDQTAGQAAVAVVQGGTPQTGMGAMDVRRAVLDAHVAQTMALSRRIAAGRVEQPRFVVWPENSSDLDPFADPGAAQSIDMAARAVGVPILVGAIVDVPGNPQGVWNMGIVWDPVTGPGQTYAKRHPVPFGEYIPMRSLIARFVERLDRVPRDFLPGERAGLLDIGSVRIGDLICFEVAYDDVVQPLIEAGPALLTVQTNNATYAGTSQPEQQLQITRMRAVESGRTVAVAATTGISAVIASDGSVSSELGQGRVGSLVEQVPLAVGVPLAARVGPEVTALLGLVALGAIGVGIVHRRRG